MSILQRLPESVIACGREYAINTDFRVWIEVEKLIFDKSVREFCLSLKCIVYVFLL